MYAGINYQMVKPLTIDTKLNESRDHHTMYSTLFPKSKVAKYSKNPLMSSVIVCRFDDVGALLLSRSSEQSKPSMSVSTSVAGNEID